MMNLRSISKISCGFMVMSLAGLAFQLVIGADPPPNAETEKRATSLVPDPKQVGGEPESVVQVANLVYAGVKSSQCFADHFLIEAEKKTAISTSRRFHAVKLGSQEIYGYPLLIMTGEGDFALPDSERERNENETLETPPLVRTPGSSALTRRTVSMKATA